MATYNITDHTPEELHERLAPLGLSAVAVRRIYSYAVQYHHPELPCEPPAPEAPAQGAEAAEGAEAVESYQIRGLALPTRALLRRVLRRPRLTVVERRRAADGFVKYLFRTPPSTSAPGGDLIEAVRIPLFDKKYTLCVSSQVGCALACGFCATGRMGFLRNLETWEIVEQVRTIRAEADRPVKGVVFMGMGEPFLNYDNVIRAARIFSHPCGLGISARAISISTAGIVPAIRRFTAEGHKFRLAFSLTAATTEKRRSLMPIEKKYPVHELMDAVRDYHKATGERVMLEYVAIAGKNCSVADAQALKALIGDLPVRFNLIEVSDATGTYQPPDEAERLAFRDALQILGQPIVRRYSGGKEIHAACGMLAAVSCDGAGVILPA